MVIPIKAVKQERMIPTEVKPQSVAFTPNDRIILVTNEGSNTISIISSLQEKVLKNIEVGIAPTAIVVTKDGKKAYVANHKDRIVSVIDIDGMKKIKDISVGENPVSLAIIDE
jgi:YVTN family beta-propeller protein